MEGFVTDPNGPLSVLSKEWVYGLSEDELEKIAREDDETVARRAEVDAAIRKLHKAQGIAQNAREQTRSLRDL